MGENDLSYGFAYPPIEPKVPVPSKTNTKGLLNANDWEGNNYGGPSNFDYDYFQGNVPIVYQSDNPMHDLIDIAHSPEGMAGIVKSNAEDEAYRADKDEENRLWSEYEGRWYVQLLTPIARLKYNMMNDAQRARVDKDSQEYIDSIQKMKDPEITDRFDDLASIPGSIEGGAKFVYKEIGDGYDELKDLYKDGKKFLGELENPMFLYFAVAIGAYILVNVVRNNKISII
jgi:hypothetical protein